MILLKCKMCGGEIELNPEQTLATCEYCNSKMTMPRISDEHKANLFNRANHYRQQNEFDKALGVYESILAEDSRDAEAHWGIVLSKYGIEYVEDPITHKRKPTCHRIQNESILADLDYKEALANAKDEQTKAQYIQEAEEIAAIQKNSLAVANKETPYDIFICYKETDKRGGRTKDSVIAQDIYSHLTDEGYKVFFSRITLEDKLGAEYEPYIFAALNSAKVMLVIGTSKENFEMVWVKNEWSRFLVLSRKDRSKLLIPCYCDMNPVDLPDELSMLQGQDINKIGFIQDLIRGIKKVITAPTRENLQKSNVAAKEQILELSNQFARIQFGSYKVVLRHPGDTKLNVIKVVNEVTNVGLKGSKEAVDCAPSVIVSNQSKDEAEICKRRLEEVGATADVFDQDEEVTVNHTIGDHGQRERYYEVLGLSKDAGAKDIKKAYRKIAQENHPDIKPGDAEAEGRFKEATEAYAVLGKKGACYVATAVYGSYDCPQVWTLRRYRDSVLAKTRRGRIFIRLYYAISPTIVRWFGETQWFNSFFKGKLDWMTRKMKKEGLADTPYSEMLRNL